MPPVDPSGPKKASQFPSKTKGAPGHSTPEKPVLPVSVQPEKSPVSKPPLTTRFALADVKKPKNASTTLAAKTDLNARVKSPVTRSPEQAISMMVPPIDTAFPRRNVCAPQFVLLKSGE